MALGLRDLPHLQLPHLVVDISRLDTDAALRLIHPLLMCPPTFPLIFAS